MRLRDAVLLLVILGFPSVTAAQDFGVMESAETINKGNFKLGAYPIFVLPDLGDTETGIGVQGGYGMTDAVDIEGRLAFYDNLTFVGGDAEFWLVKNAPLDLSARAGFHFGLADIGPDSRGVDLAFIASGPVAPRLEIFGALDLAFNSLNNNGGDYRTVHVVPGIEYALSSDLDFLSEFGLGVNDDSSNYFAIGLTYYFR